MHILNIAAYRFVNLAAGLLPEFAAVYKAKGDELHIKGTILLSTEGINLTLAGEQQNICLFKDYLAQNPLFADLVYKESFSEKIPFKRMFVKIKKEIITLGLDHIKPQQFTAPYLAPKTLKQWYDDHHDMIILDTRNHYEVECGTFKNAINLNIETFTDFPYAVKHLPLEYKAKTVVTFCTGGIRCEKAAVALLEQGYQHVYQLEGGILNYFEQCHGDYYEGSCFVFDERIMLDANLMQMRC